MACVDPEVELLGEAFCLKVAAMMSAEHAIPADCVEEWHLIDNTRHRLLHVDSNEPLMDTTENITLHSKRTERLQKKLRKKAKKRLYSSIHSFLDLPSELLLEILTYLRPSDVFSLIKVSQSARDYVEANESVIGEEILHLRYPVLAKCFPLPILLEKVNEDIIPVLLGPRHQQRLIIHKAPYRHILPSDPQIICSCMACVLAWNNLCLVTDLAHWQNDLDEHEPIPMLDRGLRPAWNTELIRENARIVKKAIQSPLWRARLMQRHLDTTVKTIIRSAATWKKTRQREVDVNPSRRLYRLSNEDIAAETDAFLQRSGPPSFEFPLTRDNYYTLLSYLPNRRWDSSEKGSWLYYDALHDNDVAWAKRVYDQEQERLQSIAAPQSPSQKPAEVTPAALGASMRPQKTKTCDPEVNIIGLR